MSRKFITLVTATAIAVAGLTASQAQADKRTRNVILGAATLAIIGAAIADANNNDAVVSTHGPRPRPHRPRGGHWHGNTWHQHGHGHGHGHGNSHAHDSDHPRGPQPGVHPRPVPGRVMFSELPQQCAMTVRNQGNAHKVFTTRCLKRHYKYANRLPRECRREIWTNGRKISAYGGGCLRNYSQGNRWVNRR